MIPKGAKNVVAANGFIKYATQPKALNEASPILRVLMVRIHFPPADSPSLSRFRLRSWKGPGFAPVWRGGPAAWSAETRKVQQHRAEQR
jgi:hypothetical protein